ncbi:hypothetical protein AX15_005367 [Amanita polypyramis BW_CC]|nr:hypothetical protein AX15_005367 [Amanita polypyramis BW_CC]
MRLFPIAGRPAAVLHVVLKRTLSNAPYALGSHSDSQGILHKPSDTNQLYQKTRDWTITTDRHPALRYLICLVKARRFGAAERILHSIVGEGKDHQITLHPVYESAALAALRWDDPDRALRWFTTWFKLVPHIKHPNARLMKRARAIPGGLIPERPFTDTLHMLLQSGKPYSSVPMIKQFALICASKGYVNYVYNWVAEPLARTRIPVAEFAELLGDMEEAAVRYEASYSVGRSRVLASQLRVAAVQLFCHLGWHRRAQDVLKMNALDPFVFLPDELYDYAIQSLQQDKRNFISGIARRVKLLDELREFENAKRSSRKRFSRPQVELNLAPTDTSKPPDTDKRYDSKFKFTSAVHTTDVDYQTGDHVNSLLTVTGRLAVCYARLTKIEAKLTKMGRSGQNNIIGLLSDIFAIQSFLSSGPNQTTRYIELVSEYMRLRAIALSSGYKRHAVQWLTAEIFVYDFKHDHDQIFRLVYAYYSLEDMPNSYSDVFKKLIKSAYWLNGPKREESPEDKLVLDPRSREGGIFLKWLVVRTALQLRDPNAKDKLTSLWSGFRGTDWERAASAVESKHQKLAKGYFVYRRIMLDLLPAFIWSFTQIRAYEDFVTKAEEFNMLPWPNALHSTPVLKWLGDIWTFQHSELGCDPSWKEYSSFVRSECEQDELAEEYIQTMRERSNRRDRALMDDIGSRKKASSVTKPESV